MDYTSNSEAPQRYHFWTGISTIAGALQRHVWIDQFKFQWVPNFYIILVGPAGVVTKSTTLSAGMGLLEGVKGVDFGPESMTWQALGESLMASQVVFEYKDPDLGQQKMVIACETIAASEAGTLLKLEDDGMVSMLINMWDGQKSLRPWKHQTRSQKAIEIKNPWLNIIACTTPTWLQTNYPEHLIGGGLTSRIIFVYADKKVRRVAYPKRDWERSGVDAAKMEEFKRTLIADLSEIAALAGPFKLTDEAMDWGEAWYNSLDTRPPHLANPRFDAYIARKQIHLHKIAMIIAAAERDVNMIITKTHLEKALAILDDVEQDMVKVFQSIGLVQEAQQRNEITHYLRIRGQMTVEQLWAFCCNSMPMREFQEGIKAAVDANIIEKYPVAPPSRFGVRLVK